MLPQIRQWLGDFSCLRKEFESRDSRIASMTSQGTDVGGQLAEGWVEHLAGMKAILKEFQQREVELKDLERGLVDFPSLRNGQEVFLCWENGEDDIEHWHELDAGYAGRKPL